MTGNVLILGATGRFGRHAAEAFWNRGWRVTLFDRATDDLITAAQGQDVIVNGWNPPYHRWARDVPALTARVIEAANASGAAVIVPGNVYVYGAEAGPTLDATTPHRAQNPLGQIRVEMERAYRASGVRVILLRGGDFLDTETSGNWFDKVIVEKTDRGIVEYPGDPDMPHAWAYLPDFAQAAVLLAERRDMLNSFIDVPFPGYTLTGWQLCGLVAEATNRRQELRRMNWLPVQVARPFWPLARHLLEMRYLWSMSHALDGSRFQKLVPEFLETPVGEAVASAVRHKIRPDKPMTGPVIRVAVN